MHRQAVAIFEDTMKKISSDPINSLNIGNYDSPGNKLKRLCDTLLSQERDNTKITDTVLAVFALFKDVNIVKEKDQEMLWKLIHNYKVNERIIKEWYIYLRQYNDDSSSYLYLLDTFVMNIVSYVIEFENRGKYKNLPVTPKEVPLNDNEQQILRYVSGYIVFSLKKKYNLLSRSSKSKEGAIAALQLLGTFVKGQISKVHNFLDFTHRWVEQVNRGGLVEVKDEFYLFIRSIENSIRKTLNIGLIRRYEGEDLRDVLRNEILQNYLVERYWHSLVHYLPSEQLANTLKLQIVEKWIDIRARSFVSCYVQLLKRKIASSKIKNVISTRTEPAMRKTLH